MQRRKLPCIYDDCPHPRYAKKRCAGHYLADFPPARPERPSERARKPPSRVPAAPKPRGRSKPAKPRDEVPAEARAVVLARCAGRCEACGKPLLGLAHLHHRLRRRDGNHSPANLVALHPDCHVVAPQAVHQRPAWARERGLIVPSWDRPEDVPLVLPDGRTVLLGEEARYQPPMAA